MNIVDVDVLSSPPKYIVFIHMYIDIGRCGMSANETTLHPNNKL